MPFLRELSLKGMNDALRFRLASKVNLLTPVDVFQLAVDQGVEVRFVDLPSLEAMYVKAQPPHIIISSQRPYGRQVFDCAHELGHHYYGHGSKVDEYLFKGIGQGKFDGQEFLANSFASFLLMPKTLVNHAFTVRGWKAEESSVIELYTIANWIGVGFSTLITHMRDSLHLLTRERAEGLLQVAPKSVRQDLVPQAGNSAVILVDYCWTGRAIDVQVGDYLLLPEEVAFPETVVQKISQEAHRTTFQAIRPGIGRFYSPTSPWAAYVRVSRPGFVGRSIFRHLEDPEYA